MKHIHHIIPKHMGGTDEPSNLVELTIEEHAEAHKILYETYGKIEDKVAWMSLAGLAPKAELMKEIYQLGRRNADKSIKEKYGVTNPGQLPKSRKSASERLKTLHAQGSLKIPDWRGKTHTDETKKKIGQANAISQKGEKNSQYGTMWITNGINNKKIPKSDSIPLGWYKGRKI
jgi:hypothetical protein